MRNKSHAITKISDFPKRKSAKKILCKQKRLKHLLNKFIGTLYAFHGMKGFVIPTISFVKIGIKKIFWQKNV